MKYNWIRSNKKRTVRNSCHGRDNSKKGIDLIRQNSVRQKREKALDNKTRYINARYIINP